MTEKFVCPNEFYMGKKIFENLKNFEIWKKLKVQILNQTFN